MVIVETRNYLQGNYCNKSKPTNTVSNTGLDTLNCGATAFGKMAAMQQQQPTHKLCSLRPLFRPILVIILALMFECAQSAQIVSNDINSLKEDVITVQWPMSDTSATVGKVFNFHIPQDVFQGNVHHYTVLESGKEVLPNWLSYDERLQTLRGVPGLSDKGQYNVEVVAFGSEKTPKAKDVFTLTVKEDLPHVSSSKPLKFMGKTSAKAVNCHSNEPVTMVTIVVDIDLEQLTPTEKYELAEKFASHLNIASEMLKMSPVGEKAKFDSSALVAGPGDAKVSKFSGAFLSWLVGCGKVEPDHMPVLQMVETSSANGEMSSAIGHGIIGWHVTNNRLKPTIKRVRRQVYATDTPGLTLAPPTRLPAVTVTSTDTGMVEPEMTRAVPSMVSPTFSQIQPTESQPPAIRPTSVTEVPTKVSSAEVDIRPTKVTEIETTRTPTEETDLIPSLPYTDQPSMSRSQVLEPSMSMSESEMTKPTDMLPSTSEMTKAPTRSKTMPTEATRVPPMVTTTGAPETVPTPEPTQPSKVIPFDCPEDGIDRHPEAQEKIENIQVKVGELLRFKIPEKAFFDCEDGNTRNLLLDVFTKHKELLKDAISWLRYDKKKQLLIGLPMKEDGGRNYDLLAIVIDSKGAAANQAFTIEVLPTPDEGESKQTHEFALTIDVDYDEFMSDPRNRIELANKIARLYGDKNAKRMTITKIERGSVIFAWTNNTVPSDDCPVGDIVELMSKMFTKNMTLTEEAKKAMEPYSIDKVAAVPAGNCEGVDLEEALRTADFTTREATPSYQTVKPEPEPEGGDDDDDDDVKESTGDEDDDDDDIWITTVVPAVVIVAILFIALIIACILYRKKRKGKMNMQDHHTFVNKGIPVIFADELEDKPSDSAKPLIMEEEKAPNPPPGYHRTSSESPSSTPPPNHKDQSAINDDEQELDENDVTSPLYRPPPPVTASSENKQPRPHVQPAYRNPPPYVPP